MKKIIIIIEEDGVETEIYREPDYIKPYDPYSPYTPYIPYQPDYDGTSGQTYDPCASCPNDIRNGGTGQCCCSVPQWSRTVVTT